jgi:predicted RNase H-like HicB family nuclease
LFLPPTDADHRRQGITRPTNLKGLTNMRNYKFSVVVEKDKNGYFAFVPELKGCYSQGATYEEAMENIGDAIRLHIDDRLEVGESIDTPESISLTSLEVAV